MKFLIQFADQVKDAAGLSPSSVPTASELEPSDDEADETETDDESESMA